MGTIAPLTERDRRLAQIRDRMNEEGIDALLIAGKGHMWTGRGYFRYLTDFHIWGHDGLIFVPLEGEPMLSFTSAGVAEMIAERGWITDTHADRDIARPVVRELRSRNLDSRTIGIAGHSMILPAGVYQTLKTGLPDAEFVSADALMNQIRAVKSQVELTQMRELWEIGTEAMERFAENIEPGMSEREATAEAVRYIQEQGARQYLIFYNGGIPDDSPVERETSVGYHMEICNESGHWAEFQFSLYPRSWELTETEQAYRDTQIRAYERVREAATPGTTLTDLAEVYERVHREDGWTISEESTSIQHYDFHGHGLDLIEWPCRAPTTGTRLDTELSSGMTLNYHPHRILKADVGSVDPAKTGLPSGICDTFLVTEDGGERLCPEWDLMQHRCVL